MEAAGTPSYPGKEKKFTINHLEVKNVKRKHDSRGKLISDSRWLDEPVDWEKITEIGDKMVKNLG